MKMKGVVSSNIHSIGYNEDTKELHVEFKKNSALYVYLNVPKTVFEEFVASSSAGGYFYKNVRGKYEFKKG